MSSIKCPPYIRMEISGVNGVGISGVGGPAASIGSGLFVFPLNPTTIDLYPARTTQFYRVIQGANPPVDEIYNKIPVTLTWNIMPQDVWSGILPYTKKNNDGTSDTIYFSDGGLGRFSQTQIKIDKFQADVVGGSQPILRQNVKMSFRALTTGINDPTVY